MNTLKYEVVRPDKLLFQGDALSVVLITRTGELGVYPGHAPEMLALGEGVMRINHVPKKDGTTQTRVAIAGGYAEIGEELVIVLADHAEDVAAINESSVSDALDDAEDALAELEANDPGRAYYEELIAWNNFLYRLARSHGGGAQAR